MFLYYLYELHASKRQVDATISISHPYTTTKNFASCHAWRKYLAKL